MMGINALFRQADGNYLVSGGNLGAGNDTRIMKIGTGGEILWKADLDSVSSFTSANPTPDDGYVILGVRRNTDDNPLSPQIRSVMRVNSSGQKIWLRDVHTFNVPDGQGLQGNTDIDTTDDGGFICMLNPYYSNLGHLVLMVKRLNGNGDIIWEKTYYDDNTTKYGFGIVNACDGGFLVSVAGFVSGLYESRIFKIDGNGELLWEYQTVSRPNAHAPRVALDGNILLYGNYDYQHIDAGYYISKLDQAGNLLWSQDYPVLNDSLTIGQLIELDDHTFAGIGSRHMDSKTRLAFLRLDSAGTVLLQQPIPTVNIGMGLRRLLVPGKKTLIRTADQGFLLGGWLEQSDTEHSGFLIKMDSTGKIYPSVLSGNAFYDADTDCTVDPGEDQYLEGTVLSFANGRDTFLVRTGPSGYYTLGLDTGSYTVTTRPVSPYWEPVACTPTGISLPPAADSVVSFGFYKVVQHPYITIEAHARHRICAPGTYTVKYCNTGTQAYTGVIRIQLDEALQIDSASVPWAHSTDHEVSFIENALGVSECRSIEVYYTVPCDMDLNLRTLCINAHAYSDTILLAPAGWDRSNLLLTVQHHTDSGSVEFTLYNTGNGDMASSRELVIYENDSVFSTTSVQLPAGAEQVYTVDANGSTWRATISQTTGNPYSVFTTAAIEAAGHDGQGNFSRGYIRQFPLNGHYAYDYTLCLPVLNSYDPNQKTVTPEGTGPGRLVDSTAVLEYLLEFQNTGNDTAYVVRLVDTLTVHLDPATIKPGISSHPYRFSFLAPNIIEFLFENINLPDSTTDERGSQGFVQFSIRQRRNNAYGTVISNAAAIYFDYNDPIITNTASVTVGKLLVTGLEALPATAAHRIVAYPNPVSDQAVIQVTGKAFDRMELTLYDMTGRLIRQQRAVHTDRFIVGRNGLPAGQYVFEISSRGESIGRGKLLVTE